MSIYDSRDKSAYGDFKSDPHYCENPLILKWWSPVHDQLLSERISEEQWVWPWTITPKIVEITASEIIDQWTSEDPICAQYAWYNVLMYFAISRAEKLGLTKTIRKAEWKVCPLCEQKFVEDSLPMPFVKRLGINQLDFCSPCLAEIFFNSGNNALTQEEIRNHLRNLSEILKRAPSQSFGEGMDDFRDLSTRERLAVLRVLKSKPTTGRVKELFGSWRNALVDAGVLKDGTRKTSRRTD
jgi:hypothetical protein